VWERGTGVFDNNGNVLFLEGYIEDITPRKQMEEKIRYGEKKFRQITENMSDVVWTADLNFKTTYISPSVELLLGETLEEHLKKSIQQRLSPESILKVQSILADEMEKEKNHESDKSRSRKMEIQHYKADGTLIWVEMNISSIRNEKGEMIGFQGVTRDISERKKAETELKRKVEELERFNRVMVGRENKMIDLKREVNELLEKLGQNKKYRVPGKSEEA
jgi:PAS domain S-box-containing protein